GRKLRRGDSMNRKVMAAAIAAAFAAPAAYAQTTVTIGGTINIMWDSVKATGGTRTNNAGDMYSHDRVRDGAGSNIRFTVNEDLGGGNTAFVQVESAVIQNSDQRNNALGATAFASTNPNAVSVWGNRNTGIGLRSKTFGRVLIGLWDLHYDEMYGIESGWLIANSSSSALAVWNTFGSAFSLNPTVGARYANVIRWDSPNWSGFSMTIGYARPTDPAPSNTTQTGVPAGTESVIEGKKNRAWHLAARYETGGLQVRYAYLRDRDIPNVATLSFGALQAAGLVATSLHRVTSHRLGARYRFAMGLGIGFVYDWSKWNATFDAAAGAIAARTTAGAPIDVKRRSWAIPVTYETGNHGFYGTYGRARDWKGSFGGLDVSDTAAGGVNAAINALGGMPAGAAFSLANDTGARFFTLGYTYRFSPRTNVHLSYNRINNDALARYDFFANTSGTAAGNFGADPRSWAIGLRHTF
ncbi:MAG: porin, partial [Bryobacteraceae bacterium]|nr:porin [Bryobacteraceae bacterium]